MKLCCIGGKPPIEADSGRMEDDHGEGGKNTEKVRIDFPWTTKFYGIVIRKTRGG